ncbi:Major facilitator superfamily [Salmonella enterica subsp. enterica serovar Baildon str. R6-199]|nr:Major facilitator superfamily [Salmonella enterica subsp. enterica serovar Baildon str. R6-199]
MQATATTLDHEQEHVPVNSRNKVVIASLIGTAIEFFDFYIYATAAVIVFPLIFFPQGDPTAATLQSLATFAIAFVARPIGSALFGHFGDRVGRKVTLVASLLTMGISTVIIGLLPGYATIGIFAPLLLALARFGQGLGLGGEWGGAALLATENAPPRKRALYGSFPQLGAPIGYPSRSWARRSADRLLFCQWHLPVALLAADRRAVYELGLARAVYLLGGAGDYRPVCARVAA